MQLKKKCPLKILMFGQILASGLNQEFFHTTPHTHNIYKGQKRVLQTFKIVTVTAIVKVIPNRCYKMIEYY